MREILPTVSVNLPVSCSTASICTKWPSKGSVDILLGLRTRELSSTQQEQLGLMPILILILLDFMALKMLMISHVSGAKLVSQLLVVLYTSPLPGNQATSRMEADRSCKLSI